MKEVTLTFDISELSLSVLAINSNGDGDFNVIHDAGSINRARYYWAMSIYGKNDLVTVDTVAINNYMTWNHVLQAIKQELYNKLREQIEKILEENEIEFDDLSQDTVNRVFNILDTQQSLSEE